jgi:diadenosine tetraphosphate (Ap4A) HIT family hydrolase
MADTLIHRGVTDARAGANPTVIARVRSGWVVAGFQQVVAGYCLLLPDPVVPDLNALRGDERARFLADMAAIGDVLLDVTRARRINYEILGNLEPALHAHLFPRYDSEPAERRHGPVWLYDWSQALPFDRAVHGTLFDAVVRELATRDVAIPRGSAPEPPHRV